MQTFRSSTLSMSKPMVSGPWGSKCINRIRSRAVYFGLLCCFLPLVSAKTQYGPQTRKGQAGAQYPGRTATASRVDRAPKLDGTLNDPLWVQATPVVEFLQREPYEGQVPTERTEVRI